MLLTHDTISAVNERHEEFRALVRASKELMVMRNSEFVLERFFWLFERDGRLPSDREILLALLVYESHTVCPL